MGVSSGDYRVVSRAALVLCEWMSRFGPDVLCLLGRSEELSIFCSCKKTIYLLFFIILEILNVLFK